MPRKSKKTEENQVIEEVTNEIGYYEVPDEQQDENVVNEDFISEKVDMNEKMPSPEKISFFNSVQTLVDIVEDMFIQGKLTLKQSHDAYECFININNLINEI